jgi:hypothetical protein
MKKTLAHTLARPDLAITAKGFYLALVSPRAEASLLPCRTKTARLKRTKQMRQKPDTSKQWKLTM